MPAIRPANVTHVTYPTRHKTVPSATIVSSATMRFITSSPPFFLFPN